MEQTMTDVAVTSTVKRFWERASCGTNRANSAKHSRDYFEEIEEHRYQVEPFISSFAQFTRWHGKKMLEVGVGAGTDFLQFVRAGACAHGVDLTNEAIENTGKRLDEYGLKAHDLRVCNAEQLPYPDNTFDLVYSWGVIHHAENTEQVFDEIYRVVKPGGRVKLMVYNLKSYHAWYMYLRHSVLRGKPWHGRRWAIYHFQESLATKAYSRREMTQMLARYPHARARFLYWNQTIREGARWERTRRLLDRLMPSSMRWYLAIEFRKESS